MTNQANTLWVKGFSPDGFQVSVTLEIKDASEITSVLDQVRAQGICPTPPPAQPVTDRMTITTVARRMWTGKDGKQKHAVDLYPDWAQYRVFTIYLDTDDDVKAFESATGKSITSFPVINSRSAAEKIAGDPNLVNCEPEFDVLYNKEIREDGKIRDVFLGYANEAPASDSLAKVTPMPASTQTAQQHSPASAKDSTTPVYNQRLPWPKDPRDATEFFTEARKWKLQPAFVLARLEGDKKLTLLSETTLNREDAYKRLHQIRDENMFATSKEEGDGAASASPLAGNGGTVPDGFKTQKQVDDIPF